MNYNSNILFLKEQTKPICRIDSDSLFLLKNIDKLNYLSFESKKHKLYSLYNGDSHIEKYIENLQINSYLYYNGSFQSDQGLIYLISLYGHSGAAINKIEGYVLFEGDEKLFLIKVYSQQIERESFKSYFHDDYILIIKDFNLGYDSPKFKATYFEYMMLKLEDKTVKIVSKKNAEKVLKEKFANIKRL